MGVRSGGNSHVQLIGVQGRNGWFYRHPLVFNNATAVKFKGSYAPDRSKKRV